MIIDRSSLTFSQKIKSSLIFYFCILWSKCRLGIIHFITLCAVN